MTALEIDTLGAPSAACFRFGEAAGRALQPDRDLARMREWPLHSYLDLPAVPASARRARLHARTVLHVWRLGALADTVELLVSEIVTNAVRASAALAGQPEAGQAAIRLWLTSDGHDVLIQVRDGDHHRPARRDAAPDAEAGRGLLLVETLSEQWGWCYPHDMQGRKIIWAMCAQ